MQLFTGSVQTEVDKIHPQYPNDPGNPNRYVVGQALSSSPRQIGALWVAYTWAGTTLGTEARYLGSYTGRDYLVQPSPSAQSRVYKASTLYNITVTRPLASRVTAIGYIQNLTNTERYESTNAEYVRGRRVGIGMRAEY